MNLLSRFLSSFICVFLGIQSHSCNPIKGLESKVQPIKERDNTSQILFLTSKDKKQAKIYSFDLSDSLIKEFTVLPKLANNIKIISGETGAIIAFTVPTIGTNKEGLKIKSFEKGIWKEYVIGTNPIIEYDLSPIGDAIAYSAGAPNRDIFIARKPDWQTTRLTNSPVRLELNLAWKIDASGLIYCLHDIDNWNNADRIGSFDLEKNLESVVWGDNNYSVRSPKELLNNGGIVFYRMLINVSPQADEQKGILSLLYQKELSDLCNISMRDFTLTISPGGEKIAFIGAENNLEVLLRKGQLYIIKIKDKSMQKIGTAVDSYCWLDDNSIALSEWRQEKRQLRIVNLTSGFSQVFGFSGTDCYSPVLLKY